MGCGLSVAQAATTWGLTEAALYKIERGKRINLQADTWVKLSVGLGVPIGELMALTNGAASPQEVTA
jgi:DNA-binding XRE family transcriptional regulator